MPVGKLKFGKYKGYTLQEIRDEGEDGIGYLNWLLENTEVKGKYAKQNQALLDEIQEVLEEDGGGNETRRVPDHSQLPRKVGSPQVSSGVQELKKIAEKLDKMYSVLRKLAGLPEEITMEKEELQPDEEVPF